MIRYQIVRQELETPELGRYVSYGIEAVALPGGQRLAAVGAEGGPLGLDLLSAVGASHVSRQ